MTDLPPVGTRITIRGVCGTITDHAEAGVGPMALWMPDDNWGEGRWMDAADLAAALTEEDGRG